MDAEAAKQKGLEDEARIKRVADAKEGMAVSSSPAAHTRVSIICHPVVILIAQQANALLLTLGNDSRVNVKRQQFAWKVVFKEVATPYHLVLFSNSLKGGLHCFACVVP